MLAIEREHARTVTPPLPRTVLRVSRLGVLRPVSPAKATPDTAWTVDEICDLCGDACDHPNSMMCPSMQ